MSGDEDRWRTVAETADHFHVSRKRVYRGVQHESWPHRRAGEHIRAAILFDPAQDWPVIGELLRPATVAPMAVGPSRAQIQRGLRRLAA